MSETLKYSAGNVQKFTGSQKKNFLLFHVNETSDIFFYGSNSIDLPLRSSFLLICLSGPRLIRFTSTLMFHLNLFLRIEVFLDFLLRCEKRNPFQNYFLELSFKYLFCITFLPRKIISNYQFLPP